MTSQWFLISIFLVLNFFHFVPSYLYNRISESDSKSNSQSLSIKVIFKNVIRRFNYDVFRFNGDLSIFLLIISIFSISKSAATWIFFGLFLFGFLYLVYYHGIRKSFSSEPVLANDLVFMRTGLTIAVHGYLWLFVLAILGIILTIVLFYFCSAYFIDLFYLHRPSKILIGLMAVVSGISIFSMVKYFNHPNIYGFLSTPSPLAHFFTNILNSIETLQENKKLKAIDFSAHQVAPNLDLIQKPNFHFIVVESYGSLYYKDIDNRTEAKEKCNDILSTLKKAGWHMRSNYSEAPISGGASWLSYSTLLKGIRIDTHNKYYSLLKDRKHLEYFPILKLFGQSGYKSFILSSLGGYTKVKINWDQLKSFLGASEVVKYSDLEYRGPEFGMGPSPPDQFSIHKGFSLMKQKYNDPIAYFFISQNSHYMWHGPSKVIDDWKVLSEDKEINLEPINDKDVTDRYVRSITYQLETFVDFINHQDDNNVFVLIGDHQPFNDKKKTDDYFTPIHVISKDKSFLLDLESEGFLEGLMPSKSKAMKHEGVHSLIVSAFQKAFGNTQQKKFPYLKDGVT